MKKNTFNFLNQSLSLFTAVGLLAAMPLESALASPQPKRLMVNIHVQSKDMQRVIHFKNEFTLTGENEIYEPLPRYDDGDLTKEQMAAITKAFSKHPPGIHIDSYPEQFGGYRICLTFKGDLAGLEAKSNFNQIINSYLEGFDDGNINCLDLSEVEQNGGIYAVLFSDRDLRPDGTKEQRKRFAIYINVL